VARRERPVDHERGRAGRRRAALLSAPVRAGSARPRAEPPARQARVRPRRRRPCRRRRPADPAHRAQRADRWRAGADRGCRNRRDVSLPGGPGGPRRSDCHPGHADGAGGVWLDVRVGRGGGVRAAPAFDGAGADLGGGPHGWR
jgi:hypothetical protein